MDEYDSFINNLSSYEKSLQEEYKVASSSEDRSDVRKLIEQKIAQALPGFVNDLILIARTGDTDSTRLKAIQFAFSWYFENTDAATDPFSVLLNELAKDPENAKKESKDAV